MYATPYVRVVGFEIAAINILGALILVPGCLPDPAVVYVVRGQVVDVANDGGSPNAPLGICVLLNGEVIGGAGPRSGWSTDSEGEFSAFVTYSLGFGFGGNTPPEPDLIEISVPTDDCLQVFRLSIAESVVVKPHRFGLALELREAIVIDECTPDNQVPPSCQ